MSDSEQRTQGFARPEQGQWGVICSTVPEDDSVAVVWGAAVSRTHRLKSQTGPQKTDWSIVMPQTIGTWESKQGSEIITGSTDSLQGGKVGPEKDYRTNVVALHLKTGGIYNTALPSGSKIWAIVCSGQSC